MIRKLNFFCFFFFPRPRVGQQCTFLFNYSYVKLDVYHTGETFNTRCEGFLRARFFIIQRCESTGLRCFYILKFLGKMSFRTVFMQGGSRGKNGVRLSLCFSYQFYRIRVFSNHEGRDTNDAHIRKHVSVVKWQNMPFHGRFYENINVRDISKIAHTLM